MNRTWDFDRWVVDPPGAGLRLRRLDALVAAGRAGTAVEDLLRASLREVRDLPATAHGFRTVAIAWRIDRTATEGVAHHMSADEVSADSPGAHSWAVEFSALAAALDSATSREAALERIVAAGTALLPGADMVSISLRRDDGSFLTAARTAPLAQRLDELQYFLREGPCVLASRRAGLGMFESSDLGADPLVSQWGPAAAREGVHSAMAVGLFAHEDPPRIGALNFFAFTRGALDDADRDAAVVLAAHAAAVLHAYDDAEAAERENANLREALRNRDLIGQAKGILMEREGIDEDAAFDILRSVSQRMNVKLSEIARTVTDRHSEI